MIPLLRPLRTGCLTLIFFLSYLLSACSDPVESSEWVAEQSSAVLPVYDLALTPTQPNFASELTTVLNNMEAWVPRPGNEWKQAPNIIRNLGILLSEKRAEIFADAALSSLFCQVTARRAAYFVRYAQFIKLPPGALPPPQDAFDDVTAQNVLNAIQANPGYRWRGSSNNNRYVRDAATANLLALLFREIHQGRPGSTCLGLSPAHLAAKFDELGKLSLNAMFDSGDYQIAINGAYREGPAYLFYTYEALLPFMYLTYRFEGVNLFYQAGRFHSSLPNNLQQLYAWLLRTQNEDGSFPSINDSGRVPLRSAYPALALATYLLNAGDPNWENNVRKDSCGSLARHGNHESISQVETACMNDDFCKEGDTIADLFRLAIKNFNPAEAALPQGGTTSCGSYYSGTKYREQLPEAAFEGGGQLYLYSRTNNKIQARFFNEGAWRKQTSAEVSACAKVAANQASITEQQRCNDACNKVIGASSPSIGDLRTCNFLGNGQVLPSAFTTPGETLSWVPRIYGHKRYNDTHFEIRVAGREMLIGPGRMGYISNVNPPAPGQPLNKYFDYESWNYPDKYNLSRVLRRYPKTLYHQPTAPKLEQVWSNSHSKLYRMNADNLSRYVLWARQRYFIIVDVAKTSNPVYIGSHFHFRTLDQSAPAALYREGKYYSAKRMSFHEWSPTVTGMSPAPIDNADPLTGISFHSLFPMNRVTTSVEPQLIEDTCTDGLEERGNSNERAYCKHVRLNVVTEHSQQFLPFLLWPFWEGQTSPSIVPRVVTESSQAIQELKVKIAADGFTDCWQFSREGLDAGEVVSSCW